MFGLTHFSLWWEMWFVWIDLFHSVFCLNKYLYILSSGITECGTGCLGFTMLAVQLTSLFCGTGYSVSSFWVTQLILNPLNFYLLSCVWKKRLVCTANHMTPEDGFVSLLTSHSYCHWDGLFSFVKNLQDRLKVLQLWQHWHRLVEKVFEILAKAACSVCLLCGRTQSCSKNIKIQNRCQSIWLGTLNCEDRQHWHNCPPPPPPMWTDSIDTELFKKYKNPKSLPKHLAWYT